MSATTASPRLRAAASLGRHLLASNAYQCRAYLPPLVIASLSPRFLWCAFRFAMASHDTLCIFKWRPRFIVFSPHNYFRFPRHDEYFRSRLSLFDFGFGHRAFYFHASHTWWFLPLIDFMRAHFSRTIHIILFPMHNRRQCLQPLLPHYFRFFASSFSAKTAWFPSRRAASRLLR